MGKPCQPGCTCAKHGGKEYTGKRETMGRCVPGCTCSRHKKCKPGCRCAKHQLETRRMYSRGQLAYMETAERLMCECGAGPFIGIRGLKTHQRVSKVHGGISPRLGIRKKARG